MEVAPRCVQTRDRHNGIRELASPGDARSVDELSEDEGWVFRWKAWQLANAT
jgi:hypothetical protein